MAITSETRCCEKCGKPLPLDAPPRARFCRQCRKEKRKEYQHNYHEAHKDELNAYQMETYHYYKSRGICVHCHYNNAIVFPDGRRSIYCEACAEKNRQNNKRCREMEKKKA